MIILPAIDLYDGKAVRLARGDYSQMTVYSDDPASVALGFKTLGATHLHVVDLEGARDGSPANFDVIRHIIETSGLNVQVGGGIRTAEIVDKYIGIGVKRVILGTAAVSSPGLVADLVSGLGDAVAVSVDIKDGQAAIKGWTEVSELDALSFCDTITQLGVRTLICTDISKDGLLAGTNMDLYRTLRSRLDAKLIASGGISDLDEIRTLSALGMDGAILGKALYTGDIDLADAIAACG